MPLTLTNGKRDVTVEPPLMNSSGSLGFSDEGRNLMDLRGLGAFVTNPISRARRSPAHGPNLIRFLGGFLLHTGHPNPGLAAILRLYRRRWQSLPCPLFAHLQAMDPSELGSMLRRLESIEEISAVELGLEGADPAHCRELVRVAVASQLPVLARIPLNSLDPLAYRIAELGVAALVVGPPRGSMPAVGGGRVSGRLYGPALLPLALRTVEELAGHLPVPVIGSGGIQRREDVDAMLQAGASAVQLDFSLWTEPEAVLAGAPLTL